MSLSLLEHLLASYGYYVLFPLCIIEGPVITIFAGLLVSAHVFNPFIVYMVSVAGDITGDCIYFAIGRTGGQNRIARVCSWVGITRDTYERVRTAIERHPFKTVFISKIIHGIGPAGLIAAGASCLRFSSFLQIAVVYSLIQSGLFLIIGMTVGTTYQSITNTFERYTFIVSTLTVIIFILLVLRKIRRAKESV